MNFNLAITVDAANGTADFRLLDAHQSQLAYRQTDFRKLSLSHQLGLFDLRNYVRSYVDAGDEKLAVAQIGVCIAEEVLGQDIFSILWTPQSQRTLRIELPGPTSNGNPLSAALAHIPWEIARPAVDKPTLEDRSLLIRVVHDAAEPANTPLRLGEDEALRVLFVFAEAQGSPPLGMRQERRELQRLLQREIYPKRRVIAHMLSHGVTRERLKAQIAENSGYHLVHWSGHGYTNLLELAKPGGARDHLSGEELLDIFAQAGGFIPCAFFLSACHSGEILGIKNWNEFIAVAHDDESKEKKKPSPIDTKDIAMEQQPGHTGTAHALLAGGVPSIVAMRYSVGDEYARGLAVEFYRALLAHAQPKTVLAALTMARRALRDPAIHQQAVYAECDHATPVLYGAEHSGLAVPPGRSPSLNTRNPRLHRIAELTSAEHEHFVGRTWELAQLGADFIGASAGTEVRPVAVVTGLGGMGKTALTAEALALWENRFEWVLLYQAKPSALSFEAALTDMHLKLMGELRRYYDHVQSNPADAIHRAATTEFTGEARTDRLISNLIRALADEPILLVLDNLETNLKPGPVSSETGDEPTWAFQDPAWDACIRRLALELSGTPSRVLITCRRPLAALAGTQSNRILLGPMPAGEAALYLREHAGLSRMVFGGDPAERALALRLLAASRFHPLLMDRLARLATGEASLRPQLLQALDTLEQHGDFTKLPALFETAKSDARQLAYLNDALAISIDQLIEGAVPYARVLLWIVSLANDPVALGLVRTVWDAVSSEKPRGPDPLPLLRYLAAVGLITEERRKPDDDNPSLTCHETVRDRIRGWMTRHPQDQVGFTERNIRLCYAEGMEAAFSVLRSGNQASALEAGRRAIIYYVEAEAYDRLGRFAVGVVIGASDVRLLKDLLPHLQAAAHLAPPGRNRWSCLLIVADAMDNSGSTNESLPFYDQAAALAKFMAEDPSTAEQDARQAWMDQSTILGNWSVALQHLGDLGASREKRIEATRALENAGAPEIYVLASALEALRLEVDQGKAAAVISDIEKGVAKMLDWWNKTRAGETVPEAPLPAQVPRLLVNALDVGRAARAGINDWNATLHYTDLILSIMVTLRHPPGDIAAYLRNRAAVLVELERYSEAKEALEQCLPVFHDDPINLGRTLNALANLFLKQQDIDQAITQQRKALALFNTMPSLDDRSAGHTNLANCLARAKAPELVAEGDRHRLAGLIYAFVIEHGSRLEVAVQNYAAEFGQKGPDRALAAIPRVVDLLGAPGFHALREVLDNRGVNLAELQKTIDENMDKFRRQMLDGSYQGE